MAGRLLSFDGQLARSAYPERLDKASHLADRWTRALADAARQALATPVRREIRQIATCQAQSQAAWAQLDDVALRQAVQAQAAAAVHGLVTPALHQALALLAEAARRCLGLRPYPVQLLGAASLLRGRLVEMHTGEGKTLTAGLAACLAAVAGVPVHVVTVNDYLAQRDADGLAPLFNFFGLGVGVVVHGLQPEAKRAAYAQPICYCTNKELVFDYLRDRSASPGRTSAAQLSANAVFNQRAQPPLLRGLHLAIVDEIDSILIDEARTPLILAEKAGPVPHAEAFAPALALAAQLVEGQHFQRDRARRALYLSPSGRERVKALSAPWAARSDSPWRAEHAREHLVLQALRAQHLFLRDQHYLVDDEGKVQIIDEYTGRVLPGRNWEQGLHQMVEAKEGLDLSEQTRTLARITYQRFFARYLRLSGMTGTAQEVARELALVVRLRSVVLPPHRPSARRRWADRVCQDEDHKWQAVAQLVAERHALGQPVLVGTRSLQASERLATVLAAKGLPHRVLNARQDAQEASTVAAAGQRGAITVATNMAGRGTDIALGEGVAALGGLAVVLTEYHESPRIDRQLFGRCARQGDPGLCVAVVAIDDPLLQQHGGLAAYGLARRRNLPPAWRRLAAATLRHLAQARAEKQHARTRAHTLKRDHDLDKAMAFSGDAS